MNAPTTIAARDLARLLDAACNAAEAFNAYVGDDPEWDRLNAEAAVAECQLLLALAEIGLDKARLARALNAGVIW